jgi:hypothetical protein
MRRGRVAPSVGMDGGVGPRDGVGHPDAGMSDAEPTAPVPRGWAVSGDDVPTSSTRLGQRSWGEKPDNDHQHPNIARQVSHI